MHEFNDWLSREPDNRFEKWLAELPSYAFYMLIGAMIFAGTFLTITAILMSMMY